MISEEPVSEAEEQTDESTGNVVSTIIPLYDNEDNVCGICYNGETYYFVKNLQGDVVAIADVGNTVVARYSYDAWGKCTIVSDSTAVSIATGVGISAGAAGMSGVSMMPAA